MKSLNYIFFIVSVALFSCEQEVDLELPLTNDRLVVEANLEQRLSGEPVEHQVSLSTLSSYFDNQSAPRVSDAKVSVIEENGAVYEFVQRAEGTGMYLNDELVIKEATEYQLYIEWRDNIYVSTAAMTSVPPIDDAYTVFEEENTFEDGGLKVAVDFTDPADKDNFYFWQIVVNGEIAIFADPGNKNNIVAKDDLFNGQQIIGYFPNEEIVVEPGDQVVVRQIGLDRSGYEYYFLLFDTTGKTGQLIDTPPAQIYSNISNVSNSQNIALGYFRVSQVAEASLTVSGEE